MHPTGPPRGDTWVRGLNASQGRNFSLAGGEPDGLDIRKFRPNHYTLGYVLRAGPQEIRPLTGDQESLDAR